MDPRNQASFIPKKPLIAGAAGTPRSVSILWLASLILFGASLIGAGIAFGYSHYLGSVITQQQKDLSTEEAAYDPTTIEELIRLDTRLNQATSLLAVHISPSAIFALLQQYTLKTVRFTSFDYSNADASGLPTMTLTGEALDFSSVALQSDAFGQSTALKDVIFSNVAVAANGHITFQVSANLDPSILLYSKSVAPQSSQASPSSTTSSTTTPAGVVATSTAP